ncbi:MAG TPA: glycosyltransferase family 1 protein [Candidatus Saccharimonadales bacterium]|nr:glycosyltransferase family 1 protein [Candidatus Saccharimonadales bacterium]
MAKKHDKISIYVESIPLVEDRPSGVAHSIAGLITELAKNSKFREHYEVVLVAPKRGLHKLDRWPGLRSCRRLGLPFRMRILNGLMKFHLLPPMDLFLGKGVYLFGNFKNWPVSKHSVSFTYIHDICYALFPEFVAPKNQQMLIKNVPKFIKQTDYVITVSESSRREVMDFYKLPGNTVVSLYNGVNRDLYTTYPTAEVSRVKKKYKIEGDYFFYLGNIEPRKNLENLVKAFNMLPHDKSLVIVGGSGWLNEGVIAAIDQAKDEGAKIIKPETFVPDDDVARLLAGAVALVHPAFHEGFGMTPAEAMASHVPVVVSDIPVMHEVVGDVGIYCDPHDVGSIAQGMEKAAAFSSKERKQITANGAKRVKQFSWSASAEKLVDYIQKDRRLEW